MGALAYTGCTQGYTGIYARIHWYTQGYTGYTGIDTLGYTGIRRDTQDTQGSIYTRIHWYTQGYTGIDTLGYTGIHKDTNIKVYAGIHKHTQGYTSGHRSSHICCDKYQVVYKFPKMGNMFSYYMHGHAKR